MLGGQGLGEPLGDGVGRIIDIVLFDDRVALGYHGDGAKAAEHRLTRCHRGECGLLARRVGD